MSIICTDIKMKEEYIRKEKREEIGKERKNHFKECNYEYEIYVLYESALKGKYVDFESCINHDELKIDVLLDKVKYIRVFGIVTQYNGELAIGKKITLYGAKMINHRTQYVPICDAVTDEKGAYDILLDNCFYETHFIIKLCEE